MTYVDTLTAELAQIAAAIGAIEATPIDSPARGELVNLEMRRDLVSHSIYQIEQQAEAEAEPEVPAVPLDDLNLNIAD